MHIALEWSVCIDLVSSSVKSQQGVLHTCGPQLYPRYTWVRFLDTQVSLAPTHVSKVSKLVGW